MFTFFDVAVFGFYGFFVFSLATADVVAILVVEVDFSFALAYGACLAGVVGIVLLGHLVVNFI